MRILIISLFLFPLCLNAQQDYWAMVKTNCNDYGEARELRRQLVEDGHLVSLLYSPQWMVARLQASPASVKGQHPQILAIGEGSGTSQNLEAPSTLSDFFEKMAAGRFDPSIKSKTEETAPVDFSEASCTQSNPMEKNQTDDYALPNDFNSEYFRGLVTTSTFFIESDGSEDPNYYSWTQAALEEEKLDILMALHTWAYTAYLQGADLTFIPVWYDSRPEVNQGFEPNLHLGSFSFYSGELSKMTGSVLHNLGYNDSYIRAQGDNFSYDQRQAYESDFSFIIGVHYSHQGKGYIRANAMIGGPITYLSREYDYRVYGHEIGHIFHAFDEYLNTQTCDPSASSFNGAINGNNLANSCLEKQTCVMNDNSVLGEADQLHFAVCTYTASHFGWGEQDLAPAPTILTEINEAIPLPFFQLDAEFPERRDPLQGYVKIWQDINGHDSLIIADDLGTVGGIESWTNTRALLPGTYICIFYYGQKGQHALVPSQPLTFEINYSPAFPFRDTCLYFCQTPEKISLPQNNLRWYGDRNLQTLLHEGSDFLPDFQTDSSLYVVHFDSDGPVDIARVNILFGRSASIAVQSRVELDGRIVLSLYSFIPIQNVERVQWYRDGVPISGANDWSIYAQESGSYHVTITNGCLIQSDTFRLILPPVLIQNTLCDQNEYQLIAQGENIQWYDERRISIANADTLIVTDVNRHQLYYVTQSIDEIESPFYEISLAPLNEQERIELINTNSYLRIKGPGPLVDWWRNDTLFLSQGPLEMTAPQPGIYQVSVNNFAGCRQFSNTVEVQFRVSPPIIEKQNYSYCLQSREDIENFEGPIARAEGQNLRWYLEPEKSELISTGPTYQIDYVDLKNNARLFVTQTIDGEESPPAVIFTHFANLLELRIDNLGDALHAVVNGEDEQVLPSEYQFQWYLNDLPIGDANEEWFYPEGNGGWYTLNILNLTESCLSLDSIFINFPTGTKETPSGEEVLVFPNPAHELFYVQFENTGKKQVMLYDSNGQLLRRFQTFEQVLEINSSRLPAGLYILRCRMDSGEEVVKKVVTSRH